MKMTKKILGVLLSCLMLLSLMSVGVFAAAGTQEDPINANSKWFGYGVDCYLLNPSLTAGDEDGLWYTLTVETAGILQLENSYKNLDYTISLWVNGIEYTSGEGDIQNRPITTYPVAVGDVATVQIKAVDTTQSGGVNANIKIMEGTEDFTQSLKMKSTKVEVYVAAGQTVHYQDASTDALFAASGLLVDGDVSDTVVTTGNKNYTDSDQDGTIELKLGGTQGGTGVPPSKPSWSITNNSAENRCYVLTGGQATTVHECVYDNNTDLDCNTCGAIREINYAVISFAGNSTSKDVNGLAFRFDVNAAYADLSLSANTKYVLDYASSTITPDITGSYKLVRMGAITSNNWGSTYIDQVDGIQILDVPAINVAGINEGTPYFVIRITNIPANCFDTYITARPYFIYENAAGEQMVVYGDEQMATYNEYAVQG